MLPLLLLLHSILFSQSITLRPYLQAIRSEGTPPPGLADGKLTATGTDGALWTGTEEGLWREDAKAAPADRKRYFASKRWLPDDHVVALLPDSSAGMWVKTKTGVSHIEFRRMTLEEKAAYFEDRVRKRHLRHGFVASSSLAEPGNLASNRTGTTDNDGLWTAMYAAAECYRYAATKSPEALRYAKEAVEAILKLEDVTGRPGLLARSYITPDEPRPRDGLWFASPDGKVLWKGDTSSDEVVGHYYIFAIAYDVLPDKALKARIKATVQRMTDHILRHNLTLTDIHGLPTWWGRWDREYFESERGKPDSPLNAVEILSFLKVAAHITGEDRFADTYGRLAAGEGYAMLTARYKELRETINYSDEELAFLSFYPLLSLEEDPGLRGVYLSAMEQWWENAVREKNPLWTYIYAAGNRGKPLPLEDAVWTLQRIPMDLVSWTVKNSNRKDMEWVGEADRFQRRQAKTLLPADERPVMKWNGNPFIVDGGNGGRSEDDGAFLLLSYWMGRAHRLNKG
ncbi:MAG: hypothetical protein JST93_14460, partial [Acidobacteria bacterium]|nr:hypothetical protein [Acidobacteriota bacterium]